MTIRLNTFYKYLTVLTLIILTAVGYPINASGARDNEFVLVLDAGHGGHDHGAIDNGMREKDINLAVALKVGELVKKKLKNTKVVFTRDDDTFVSLQGRADIANKAKGDLFVSIHTNSVDAKNKNRKTVAGASVYTQGGHKDDANLEVAKRENSVIELENGYKQKYSGFDPNKVESYIIFEMAAKHNIAQSHRFAKNVQQNLVKTAGRKDRGVHQAGFWVLWATSMPSALVELDFICNPESAKFMNSKEGVDKLAEAIFEAIKEYEQNYRQKQKMMSDSHYGASEDAQTSDFADAVHAGIGTSNYEKLAETSSTAYMALSRVPESDTKDLSHANLQATRNQTRARHAAEGRRRRSASSAEASVSRDLSVNHIQVNQEFTGEMALLEPEPESTEKQTVEVTQENSAKGKKAKKGKKEQKNVKDKKDTRQWIANVNKQAQKAGGKKKGQISSEYVAAKKPEKMQQTVANKSSQNRTNHAGERKSLKRRN